MEPGTTVKCNNHNYKMSVFESLDNVVTCHYFIGRELNTEKHKKCDLVIC